MATLKLAGERILVVEDEPLIAIDITESLTEAGANIIRAHSSLDAVRRIRNDHVSAAILDVRLGEEDDCSAVCDELSRQGVPFIFYTGYADVPVLARWQAVPVVAKPASAATLASALLSVCVDRPAA